MMSLDEIKDCADRLLRFIPQNGEVEEVQYHLQALISIHNVLANNWYAEEATLISALRDKIAGLADFLESVSETGMSGGERAALAHYIYYARTATTGAAFNDGPMSLLLAKAYRLVEDYFGHMADRPASKGDIEEVPYLLLLTDLLYPCPEDFADLHDIFLHRLDDWVLNLSPAGHWEGMALACALKRITLLVKNRDMLLDNRYNAEIGKLETYYLHALPHSTFSSLTRKELSKAMEASLELFLNESTDSVQQDAVNGFVRRLSVMLGNAECGPRERALRETYEIVRSCESLEQEWQCVPLAF